MTGVKESKPAHGSVGVEGRGVGVEGTAARHSGGQGRREELWACGQRKWSGTGPQGGGGFSAQKVFWLLFKCDKSQEDFEQGRHLI